MFFEKSNLTFNLNVLSKHYVQKLLDEQYLHVVSQIKQFEPCESVFWVASRHWEHTFVLSQCWQNAIAHE